MAGWLPLFAPSTGFSFNGKKIQTNLGAVQIGGDYPFLNALKTAQSWGFANLANAPVTPDILDSDGYLKSASGNAASGIYTSFFIPSQAERPGHWLMLWDGDGAVGSGSMSATAISYAITGITTLGTIQTFTLSSSPVDMRAGQPIAINNVTGSGGWTSLWNSWRVLDVNPATNSFRIDSGITISGSPDPLTTANAAFTTSTTVANVVGGLNGSGRYAIQPSVLLGTNYIPNAQCGISSIASTSNYPHNIRFVHADDETALASGDIFTARFLSRISYFGVLRFLNWQYGQKQNVCNVTTWATRKPTTYVSYDAHDLRSDYYVGATTSLTGRKYVTGTPILNSATSGAWSGITDKSTIHVLFAHGTWTTFDATFTNGSQDASIPGHTYSVGDQVAFFSFAGASKPSNVNYSQYYFVVASAAGTIKISATSGGPAITFSGSSSGSIQSSGALFVDVGNTGTPKKILTTFSSFYINNQWPESGNGKSLATLVYDASLDGGLGAWIQFGGNSDFNSAGIYNEVPYEIQLALCEKVAAHGYWVTPVLAADPMTDFMPSLMKYVKDNKSSWHIPRWEGPNELWNNLFPQTAYASAKATAYGSPYSGSIHEWYGKILSTLGQAAAYIYGIGNLGTQYQVLGGVQTAIFVTGDTGNAFPRFGSNAYVTAGVVQAPLSGSWGTITFTAVPAAANATSGGSVKYVSHLALANYYNSNVRSVSSGGGTQGETSLAADWGGSRFTATIAAGVMTVAAVDAGAALASGMHIYGPGVPSGVTISSLGTGTGGAGTYNLSSSFSIAYTQFYTAGVDTTAITKYAASLADTVVNATITGSNFVVNSITSGNTIGNNLQIYGGTIAFASGVTINFGGTYPNFTLSSSPGNQTASFSIGNTVSHTGLAKVYEKWATFADTNFAIKRLCGYEGWYSDDYDHGTAVALLTYQVKQDSSLQTYTAADFNNFRGLGTTAYPSGVVGEFPSVFLMTGVYPSSSAWAILEDIYQNPTPPAWDAIVGY